MMLAPPLAAGVYPSRSVARSVITAERDDYTTAAIDK
jgi:hypothetical protein